MSGEPSAPMRLAHTFVLDQVRSRTYPATTRYLATLERYDEDPDGTAFRNIEVMKSGFFKLRGLMRNPTFTE
jgi:hypothetical protein